LIVCVYDSIQQQQQKQLQFWRNSDKLVKNNLNQLNTNVLSQQHQQYINSLVNNNVEVPAHLAHLVQPVQPQQQQQQQQTQFVDTFGPSVATPAVAEQQHVALPEKKNESKQYIYANGYPIIYNSPVVVAPAPAPVAVPVVPVAPVPAGPYPIQTPVVSAQGELIVESTIGGIPFDCRGRPTGHWRDTRFCDIFHACVHGYQRKTYACPIVGERTYFDEITKKCEFISKNPLGCTVNVFLK